MRQLHPTRHQMARTCLMSKTQGRKASSSMQAMRDEILLGRIYRMSKRDMNMHKDPNLMPSVVKTIQYIGCRKPISIAEFISIREQAAEWYSSMREGIVWFIYNNAIAFSESVTTPLGCGTGGRLSCGARVVRWYKLGKDDDVRVYTFCLKTGDPIDLEVLDGNRSMAIKEEQALLDDLPAVASKRSESL